MYIINKKKDMIMYIINKKRYDNVYNQQIFLHSFCVFGLFSSRSHGNIMGCLTKCMKFLIISLNFLLLVSII